MAHPTIPHQPLRVIPAPHPGRRVATVLAAALSVAVVYVLSTNPNFQWSVVGKYVFSMTVLKGFGVTIWLTFVAMSIGLAIGVTLAMMRLSESAVIKAVSSSYLWFFRGTPVLVQLIFWYNLAIVFPTLVLKIPFGPELYRASTNDLITPYVAAVLGLSLNEGAYLAEIVRAGILAIDDGQYDAGRALGLRRGQVMRKVVLPQAMRVIVPPIGNQTIGMLKLTSLVSVVAMSDLLYSVQGIYGRTFETIPLLLVASIWYLVATTVLSALQVRIERHYAKGRRSAGQPSIRIRGRR